jgi:hypothetical protein
MFKYLVGILACVAIAVLSGSPFVMLLVLPFAAWFASRILVHGGFDAWHWARQGHMKEWNGRYYEFGNIHLRAAEVEDDLVFVEKDLLKVVEQPASRTVELFGPAERITLSDSGEIALTRAGCDRLLRKCPHPEAKKLLLFLEREAYFPHEKRAGRATRPAAERKDVARVEKE